MSSSSSSDGNNHDHHNGIDVAGPSSRRSRRPPARGGADFEGPSSSRRRSNNEVWPEPFLEALAVQVAIDAARSIGRLAAAAALANVFQVCSTWRAVSRSDLLWHRVTRRIWGRTHLRQDTWRDEYMFWHRAFHNFLTRRSAHAVLHFDPSEPPGEGGHPEPLACRCLALSDNHLACGFADGAVRLFDLPTHRHVCTFRPRPRNLLGAFSRAVTGIILPTPDNRQNRLVFGTLHGDIHVAVINGPPIPRRAHVGHVVEDGVLVDFTGCGRWWVGLYAGVPGRAFHIWDGNNEELVFVGGSLTDPESVTGWQMLIDLTQVVGRIRVTSQQSAVACTGSRTIAFDLRNPEVALREEDSEEGLMVTSMDVSNAAYVIADNSGLARVRRVGTFEEVCSFRVRRGAWRSGVMGCMNRGFSLMCAGGVIRVWEVEQGQYLYRFAEEIGNVNALVADERHVVASANDGMLHIWDFGAQ